MLGVDDEGVAKRVRGQRSSLLLMVLMDGKMKRKEVCAVKERK